MMNKEFKGHSADDSKKVSAEGQECDLISRQAAIDAMTNTLWHYPNECYRNLNEYEFAKGLAELGLKSVPTVQSEIIRCKDCKHHHRDNSGIYYCGRKDYGYGWGLNDFCSDAERKNR